MLDAFFATLGSEIDLGFYSIIVPDVIRFAKGSEIQADTIEVKFMDPKPELYFAGTSQDINGFYLDGDDITVDLNYIPSGLDPKLSVTDVVDKIKEHFDKN